MFYQTAPKDGGSNYRSLSDVIIPEGVETIEDNAFYDCYFLKTVTIPNTVKEIKSNVFYNVDNLNIHFDGNTEMWDNIKKDSNAFSKAPTVDYQSKFYKLTVKNSFVIKDSKPFIRGGTFAQGERLRVRINDIQGKLFKGWASDKDGDGNDDSVIKFESPKGLDSYFTMPAYDITIFPILEDAYPSEGYTLTVMNGDVDGKESGTYQYGDVVTITAANKTAEGKIFKEWQSDWDGVFESSVQVRTKFTMPNNNVTVTTIYEDAPNPGTDPDNPDPDNPGTDPDNPGTDPDNPGTDPDNPGTDPDKPDTPNKPDKPVTPSTPPTTPDKPENPDTPKQQFTITFSGNGGMIDDETLKTILTSKNGKITNFPTPIRTGYTFDGWFTERYNGEEITAETVFTQDTTVYAQWTKNSSNNSSSSSGGGGSSSHRRGSSSSSKSTASNQKAKVSCTAGGTVIANNDGTATITPDDGYKVFAISINGEKADIPQDGKLTNLKSEDTVMVRFDPISGIITTSVPSNNSNKFIDVPAGAWYYEAVNYVVAHNLFSGMSKTKFAPNDTMTRAMLMTVLARMDGQDVTGGTTWYEKGMNWAKQKQISDGTNPQSDITREQLAAMLYRYAGYPTTTGNLSQFSDNEQTSNYAKSALCWATEKGIISGKGNNILDPKGKATRAEVAAMLMRFCEMQ